ncbi:MAG: NmrA/HSCARG family protein [Thermoplasmata archaeon]|nr:NmrA/HSCARG family protein [Thermoplasmata archaeon]
MARRIFVVSGATGKQGGAVTRSLLKRGHSVRALTRDPAKASNLRTLGAEVVEGDLRTGKGLPEALYHADGFFILTTPFDKGFDTPDYDSERRQGRTALGAAKSAGTPHVILSSATGAFGDSGVSLFESKAANERRMKELELPGTILRPATFMDNFTSAWGLESLRAGVLSFPAPAETRVELVAVSDIGEAAASVFELGSVGFGETIDLTGDARTFVEIARMLGSWIGRSVHFQEEADPRAKERFGAVPTAPDPEEERRRIEREIEALEKRWGLHMTRFPTFLGSTPVPRLDSER